MKEKKVVKLYLIPGMGSDGRMYDKLLSLYPNAEVIEFIRPYHKESIVEYAKRMAEKIDTTQPFYLLGTSLGGIITVEISKIIHPEKIILLASAKCRDELPVRLRVMKFLKIYRLIKAERVKQVKERKILKTHKKKGNIPTEKLLAMNEEADANFIDWGADAVINWHGSSKDYRKDIIHFHGTKDGLFPARFIKNFIPVKGGDHFIALSLSDELAQQIVAAIQ